MTTPLLLTLEALAARLDAGGPTIAGDAVDVRAAIAEIERLTAEHPQIRLDLETASREELKAEHDRLSWAFIDASRLPSEIRDMSNEVVRALTRRF